MIRCRPLTKAEFLPYGDVLECAGAPDKIINAGLCKRYHDKAQLDFGDGKAGLSLFDAEPRSLPYTLDLLERHPMGSQAFIPMTENDFLVVVAPDQNGVPGQPEAFLARSGQGVNYHRGTWHGVLTPLAAPGRFAVIDYIGTDSNLEEFHLAEPIEILP